METPVHACTAFHSSAAKVRLHFMAATVRRQSHIKFIWTVTMRVLHGNACPCWVCYDTSVCACVWVRAGLCIRVFPPHIAAYFFWRFSLVVLPYHFVCITSSLWLSYSLLYGRHSTTAVAQEVYVDHNFQCCVDIAYECTLVRSMCAMIDVRVCR